MTATQSLSTTGYMVVQLQQSHSTIRRALSELGIRPAMLVNGLEHYDDDALEQVRQHLAEKRSTSGSER